MKIVLVTPGYYPRTGGVEYTIRSLARRLAERHHQVTIYTIEPRGGLPNVEKRDGVTLRRYFGLRPSGVYHIPDLNFVFDLARENADVVNAHIIHSLTTFGAWMAKELASKWKLIVSTSYHGEGHSWHANLLWRPYRPVVRVMLRRADLIQAVSDYDAALIKAHFHVSEEKLWVVPNAIDDYVRRYSWHPDSGGIILYAGRLEPYKNVDKLIEAMPWVLRRNPDAKLVIMGDGSDKERLSGIAKQVGNDHVEMLPFNDRRGYLEYLSRSSVFVNLSVMESFGMSVAEAIALGVPTIVAYWRALRRYVDKGLSIGIRDLDPESVAAEINRALENGSTGVGTMDGVIYFWSDVMKLYLEMYESVLHS